MSHHHDLLMAAAIKNQSTSYTSKGNIFNFSFNSLTGWTSLDASNGVSSLVTGPPSYFKFTSTAYSATNTAGRVKNGLFTPNATANYYTWICKVTDILTADAYFVLDVTYANAGNKGLRLYVFSDRILTFDDVGFGTPHSVAIPIGVNFKISAKVNVAANTVAVYVDTTTVALGANCNHTDSADGQVIITAFDRANNGLEMVLNMYQLLIGDGWA